MNNFGFCSHDSMWKKFHSLGLKVGNRVAWNKKIWVVSYNSDIDLERYRWGLEETDETFNEPKRNEKCYCGSGKKYKKCCL